MLSVVVPMESLGGVLEQRVHDLMEVLPELFAQFEVLLVDDGRGAPGAAETGYELAKAYPQVRVISGEKGRSQDWNTIASRHSKGEIVLLCADEGWSLQGLTQKCSELISFKAPHYLDKRVSFAGSSATAVKPAAGEVRVLRNDMARESAGEKRRVPASGRIPAVPPRRSW